MPALSLLWAEWKPLDSRAESRWSERPEYLPCELKISYQERQSIHIPVGFSSALQERASQWIPGLQRIPFFYCLFWAGLEPLGAGMPNFWLDGIYDHHTCATPEDRSCVRGSLDKKRKCTSKHSTCIFPCRSLTDIQPRESTVNPSNAGRELGEMLTDKLQFVLFFFTDWISIKERLES